MATIGHFKLIYGLILPTTFCWQGLYEKNCYFASFYHQHSLWRDP
jgi:hypothetical protein